MDRTKLAALCLAILVTSVVTSACTAQTKAGIGPSLVALTVPAIAISPDGKQIVLVLGSADKQQLYLRSSEGGAAKAVPGTEGAGTPIFSPDGKWVAFFTEKNLKKVALDTGQIVNVCDTNSNGRGAVWGSDDSIIFTPDTGSALFRVPASGGKPTPLTERTDERSQRWPELLPGNKAVLYTIAKGGSWDDAQIIGQRLDTGERHVVIDGGTAPRYLPTGHLIYVHGGALMAVPFDAQQIKVTGPAVPMVQGVLMEARDGASQYSISQNGTLAYIPTNVSSTDRTFVWVNRDGSTEPLRAPARAYEHPRLSPDGKKVVVGIAGDNPNLYIYDIGANSLNQFTTEANNAMPIWTPDGKRITFRSTRGGSWNPFWKSADGSGATEQLANGQYVTEPSAWSSDGSLLLFTQQPPATRRDIWVMELTGEHKQRPLIQTTADESAPRFSPDGRWIAYVSDASGRTEVYVEPYPPSGEKWQISNSGAREPVWSPNGAELFYRNQDKMMAVDVKAEPAFTAGKPRMVFEGDYEGPISSRANFDISSDGRRFLMLQKTAPKDVSTDIKIVPNWFQEIGRRTPSK